MATKKQHEPIIQPQGRTGLKQATGYVQEEFRRRLQGDKAVRVYQEMGEDPICHAFLWFFETLVRQSDPHIVPDPAKESTSAREEAARRLQERWQDMESTPAEVFSEIASANQYGWAMMEETFKIRRGDSDFPQLRSRFADGEWGWRDIEIRSQDSLERWEFDAVGNVVGMWQRCEPDFVLRFVPMSRAMLFRPRASKKNPEGRSLLSGAVDPHYHASRIRWIEGVGVERDLAGMPVMQLPIRMMAEDASPDMRAARAKWERLVQRVRRDKYEGIVIPAETLPDGQPSGFKLSLLSSGGRRPVDVNEIVRRHESRILVSVLSELLLLGLENVGSWALHDGKSDIVMLSLNAISQSYYATFSRHAIPRMCKMLGIGPDDYPVMTGAPIETPDLTAFATAISTLSQAGVIVLDDGLEKFVREQFGLPAKDAGSPLAAPISASPAALAPIARRRGFGALAKRFGTWLRA